MKRGIEQ